ncbi:hypothetical protein HPC49_32940 [Pyxidicoccus fallax]|uniref:Glycosyl hydrolase n=1 Tax=Pyxidicoccus fallax TaxID=394095 RepID=A0A848LUD2_9BACT|nr:hypothetical protein [Pyxidicoccus fallax]NMO21638.1 hypothetical protein [Pyxidicoccus fallax]NPC83016.1 hypothetical protein [Pyxidicoccus fallax]
MHLRRRVVVSLALGAGVLSLAAPASVRAYRVWAEEQRRLRFEDFMRKPGEDVPPQLRTAVEEEMFENTYVERDIDDAFSRWMAHKAQWGVPTAEDSTILLGEARAEAQRWPELMPRPPGSKGLGQNANSWVNLGPTDARFQHNGRQYLQVDSGRISGIAVHPKDQNIGYLSTSGGGVWKTFNLLAEEPSWQPIGETLGNLAVGDMAMDPNNPDTLYVGLGDFVDMPGGQVVKTTNGGGRWETPVALTGRYPANVGNRAVEALRVRAIKVDPNAPNIVLVGTEVGLFRSTDAGASFQLVDLPNFGEQVPEAVWNIAYTGQVGGQSRWALSGVAYDYVDAPVHTAGTVYQGDIWVSTDSGQSWSSRLAANGLPDLDNDPSTLPDAGRISLAAGSPAADPSQTVLFALTTRVSDDTLGGGIWRSKDAGQTWQDVSGGEDGEGQPRNITFVDTSQCISINVHNNQAWYNSTIAVDPGDENRVILGGTYCGLRTINGLADKPTWEVVSHWLPAYTDSAMTDDGVLPYVHADWHRTLVVRTPTGYMTMVGGDGGLYTSTNVFNPGPINQQTVQWRFPNRGLATHLMYNVASGDPATGNQFIAFAGLQDNGTRFRDTQGSPTTFNQIIGGDGIGVAASRVGEDSIYWGSVQYSSTRYCDPDVPANNGCNSGAPWRTLVPPTTPAGGGCAFADATTFLTKVMAVNTGNRPAAITGTTYGVFRLAGTPVGTDRRQWQRLGACDSGVAVRALSVSTTVDGLYGVAGSGGRFRVMSGCTLDTPASQCTWTTTNRMGVDLNGNGTIDATETPTFTSSIDFPPNHTDIAPGSMFVASSQALASALPPGTGRVYLSRDRGQTWQNITNNLPNVPVNVVRFDPSDTTNQTIFAGTDLGVYRTSNQGATWERYGVGLPLVRVMDMFVGRTGGILRIATFGRGMWEIYPSATAERGVAGNGDFDRNGQVDFVDLLATANRVGTSPATQSQPYYDWNQDLVGTVNTVDDADLAQLLTRYGGRP